jgi:hypothetical protein
MRRGKATTREPNLPERFQIIAETEIQNNDVLCGRGPLSFNHGTYVTKSNQFKKCWK